jgi:nucleotide-binding universal stress UspA family protein
MAHDAPFSRILVPTDFSSGSEQAWALAQRLALALGAELVLLHVLPASPVDEDQQALVRILQAEHQLGIPRGDQDDGGTAAMRVFPGPLTAQAIEHFSPAGREWAHELEQWAEKARAAGCTVRTLLRVGVPYREVVAAAREERVDAVLLATHGRGEIQRLLVGSVADRVIRLAPCPVISVKEP